MYAKTDFVESKKTSPFLKKITLQAAIFLQKKTSEGHSLVKNV